LLKDGTVAISDSHGRFYEPAYRGGLFMASNLPTGVAPGTALSTTPTFCLANPAGSGKNLVLMRTSLGYVSGTLGGGSIVYAGGVSGYTGGTALAVRNAVIGNASTGVGLAWNGATITLPTILRPAYVLGAFLATTASISAPLVDDVQGEIIIAPGAVLCMAGIAAAGTSPLVIMSACWEEVPV
jgi:hypothetical protein